MKSLRMGFCLFLVLTAQIFAQRFSGVLSEEFITGTHGRYESTGYFPYDRQMAALGEKNSSFADLMLLGGKDSLYYIVNSYGIVLGEVAPIDSMNSFTDLKNQTVYDNIAGGVAVLDSFSDNKRNAIVLFSSLKKIIVMQITLSAANKVSYNVLKSMNLPEIMWQGEDISYSNPGISKRLALLGTTQNAMGKVYHIAIGHASRNGRVDFFSLTENTWIFTQPNAKGLASGSDGLYFEEYSGFGTDLIFIDDMDKNGYNELAVLLPASTQYPYSAIYIFFMDNEWTPSSKPPVIITGNSMPWVENPEQTQNCNSLGSINRQNENFNLLVTCNTEYFSGDIQRSDFFIKNLVLNSSGNILNASIFFNGIPSGGYYFYTTNTNPLLLKNHKNDSYFLAVATNLSNHYVANSYVKILSVTDADFSKNFLIEAGKPEIIVDLDSLFYRSGTAGFSVKTLFGLAQCEIQNNVFLCEAEEDAIGSWSSLELSSRSECDAYRECKRKDTIFVYVRAKNESSNTALRLSKNIVLPFFEQINLGNIKSLAYFKNPDLQSIKIDQNTNGLKLSTVVNNDSNGLLIIPFSQKEGIDTLVFNLLISATTNSYPIYVHIADTSKILEKAIPANPGEDTVWNTAQKRYIALPHSNSSGNIYTYDIAQDSLGAYAEILGEYIHILKVDVANISVAYTESSQIKYRKITLMPEPKALPPDPSPIISNKFNKSLNAVYINGGLQISGLNGEFELSAYNFKGVEIQRLKSNANGSVFVKLRQNTPQIVRIKYKNEQIYLKIATSH